MFYQEEWKEEYEAVMERYRLSIERIKTIETEETVPLPYREYFHRTAAFIHLMEQVRLQMEDGRWLRQTLIELQSQNRRFYEDILPENYEKSYGNPAYAAEQLGQHLGPLLSTLYAEIRGQIPFFFF